MRCIAAPVFNAYGDAVAGISVSGPSAWFMEADIARLSGMVHKAATELTEQVGEPAPTPESGR